MRALICSRGHDHALVHVLCRLYTSVLEQLLEPVLVQLDMKGICASSGSACSSHSVEPSRVVKAMGYSDLQASGLIRFSFGWNTTAEEVEEAAGIVREVASRMMSKERRKR